MTESPIVFVDSNIPMYLVGAEHPNKLAAHRALTDAIVTGRRLATSVEVLQEIMHRYAAIGRRDAIDAAFDAVLGIVEVVFPVERSDVERARRLLQTSPRISARDAIHIAVMQHHGVDLIMSFDGGFDEVPGIERLS